MYDRSGKQEEKLGGEKERRRREEGGEKEGRITEAAYQTKCLIINI